jgi:hypothetical protein
MHAPVMLTYVWIDDAGLRRSLPSAGGIRHFGCENGGGLRFDASRGRSSSPTRMSRFGIARNIVLERA